MNHNPTRSGIPRHPFSKRTLSNGKTIQTSYAYDPYGVTTSAGAATYNTYQFTGRENDGTTAGLMFYRARYYNPAWGRFVSEDPIGVAGGVNLYAYVEQRPQSYRDSSGRSEDVPDAPELDEKITPTGTRWQQPLPAECGPVALPFRPLLAPFGPEPKNFSRAIRRQVLGSKPPCVYCGAPANSLDYIVPRSKGGPSDENNVAPACIPCNSSKKDKMLSDWPGRKQ